MALPPTPSLSSNHTSRLSALHIAYPCTVTMSTADSRRAKSKRSKKKKKSCVYLTIFTSLDVFVGRVLPFHGPHGNTAIDLTEKVRVFLEAVREWNVFGGGMRRWLEIDQRGDLDSLVFDLENVGFLSVSSAAKPRAAIPHV